MTPPESSVVESSMNCKTPSAEECVSQSLEARHAIGGFVTGTEHP